MAYFSEPKHLIRCYDVRMPEFCEDYWSGRKYQTLFRVSEHGDLTAVVSTSGHLNIFIKDELLDQVAVWNITHIFLLDDSLLTIISRSLVGEERHITFANSSDRENFVTMIRQSESFPNDKAEAYKMPSYLVCEPGGFLCSAHASSRIEHLGSASVTPAQIPVPAASSSIPVPAASSSVNQHAPQAESDEMPLYPVCQPGGYLCPVQASSTVEQLGSASVTPAQIPVPAASPVPITYTVDCYGRPVSFAAPIGFNPYQNAQPSYYTVPPGYIVPAGYRRG